jgi:hypothetical protein
MTENHEFSIWMSKVEFYLESMIKKSSREFESYDYRDDFNRGFLPESTATRVIKRSRNDKERSMDTMPRL